MKSNLRAKNQIMLNIVILVMIFQFCLGYRQSDSFSLSLNQTEIVNQIVITDMNTLLIQTNSYIRHLNGSTFSQPIFTYPVKQNLGHSNSINLQQPDQKEFIYNQNYIFYAYEYQNSTTNFKSSSVRNNNIIKSLSMRPNPKTYTDGQYFYNSYTQSGQFSRFDINTTDMIMTTTPFQSMYDSNSQFFKSVSFRQKSQNFLYFTFMDKIYLFGEQNIDNPMGNIPFDQQISEIISGFRQIQMEQEFIFVKFQSMIRMISVQHSPVTLMWPNFSIKNVFPSSLEEIHYVGQQKYYSFTQDCRIQKWDFSRSLPFVKAFQNGKMFQPLKANQKQTLVVLKSQNTYQVTLIEQNLNLTPVSEFTFASSPEQISFYSNDKLILVVLQDQTYASFLTICDINTNKTYVNYPQVYAVNTYSDNASNFATIQTLESNESQTSLTINIKYLNQTNQLVQISQLKITYLNYAWNKESSSQKIFYLDQNFLVSSIKLVQKQTNRNLFILQRFQIDKTDENIIIVQREVLTLDCLNFDYNQQYFLAFWSDHVQIYGTDLFLIDKIYFPKDANYKLQSYNSKNKLLWLTFLDNKFMVYYEQVYNLQTMLYMGSLVMPQQSSMIYLAQRNTYMRFQSNSTVNFYSTLILPINQYYKIPNCQQGSFSTFQFKTLNPQYTNKAFYDFQFIYLDSWTNSLISLQCVGQNQYCGIKDQVQLQWNNLCSNYKVKNVQIKTSQQAYEHFLITYQICNTTTANNSQTQVKYDIGRTSLQIDIALYQGSFLLGGGKNQTVLDVQYAEHIINKQTRKYIIFSTILNNQISRIYKFDLSFVNTISSRVQAVGSNPQISDKYCTVSSTQTDFQFTLYSSYNIIQKTFDISKQLRVDQISKISLNPSADKLAAILSKTKVLLVDISNPSEKFYIDYRGVVINKIQLINEDLVVVLSSAGALQIFSSSSILKVGIQFKSIPSQEIQNVIDFSINYDKQEIAYFTYLDNTKQQYKTQVSIIRFDGTLKESFKLKDVIRHIQYRTSTPAQDLHDQPSLGNLILLSSSNKIILQRTASCPSMRTLVDNVCQCNEGYFAKSQKIFDQTCEACDFWCNACQQITGTCSQYNWLIVIGLFVGIIFIIGLIIVGIICLYRKNYKKTKLIELQGFLSGQNYEISDNIQKQRIQINQTQKNASYITKSQKKSLRQSTNGKFQKLNQQNQQHDI